MTAYELEFRDKAPRQALPLYREASELLEPFSCYRLAEIYLKPNKFNEAVDFELSWFYLVKSTVLGCIFYSKDVFKGK
jgi:TPR repeat protein